MKTQDFKDLSPHLLLSGEAKNGENKYPPTVIIQRQPFLNKKNIRLRVINSPYSSKELLQNIFFRYNIIDSDIGVFSCLKKGADKIHSWYKYIEENELHQQLKTLIDIFPDLKIDERIFPFDEAFLIAHQDILSKVQEDLAKESRMAINPLLENPSWNRKFYGSKSKGWVIYINNEKFSISDEDKLSYEKMLECDKNYLTREESIKRSYGLD